MHLSKEQPMSRLNSVSIAESGTKEPLLSSKSTSLESAAACASGAVSTLGSAKSAAAVSPCSRCRREMRAVLCGISQVSDWHFGVQMRCVRVCLVGGKGRRGVIKSNFMATAESGRSNWRWAHGESVGRMERLHRRETARDW